MTQWRKAISSRICCTFALCFKCVQKYHKIQWTIQAMPGLTTAYDWKGWSMMHHQMQRPIQPRPLSRRPAPPPPKFLRRAAVIVGSVVKLMWYQQTSSLTVCYSSNLLVIFTLDSIYWLQMTSAHAATVYFWAFSCQWPAYLTLCAVNFTLQTLVHA